MPKFKSQGEKIKAFTLIIPGIVNQMVKISCTAKIGDKSDIWVWYAKFFRIAFLIKLPM